LSPTPKQVEDGLCEWAGALYTYTRAVRRSRDFIHDADRNIDRAPVILEGVARAKNAMAELKGFQEWDLMEELDVILDDLSIAHHNRHRLEALKAEVLLLLSEAKVLSVATVLDI